MHLPDRVAVVVTISAWLALDVCVVYVDREDENMYRYLTNQVWLLALLSKLCLIIEVLRWRREVDYENVSRFGWITSLLFLIVGCAQFGVLAAFFLLVWLDSSLLDNMLITEHTLAEIIAWNHLRHVTVCFVHLVIVWSMRHYLSRNAETHHDVCCGWSMNFCIFCGALIGVPLFIGLLHSAIFDDQELYRFGSVDIGSKCQVAFSLFSLSAAIYFLCVPLRSSWLERRIGQTNDSGHVNVCVVAIDKKPTTPLTESLETFLNKEENRKSMMFQ